MDQQELIPHLFRTEFTKITSVICKTFGLEHIETAEDIASETFVSAMESWPYKGIPENPVAWLYVVAKNKTRNHLKRHQVFHEKIRKEFSHPNETILEIDIDLSENYISDSQLQMLFAICHPFIPAEAQIGLALRILCGFGIVEIANAFMTNKETINKRLFRAKEKLRTEKIKIEVPAPNEINQRLETVLKTLYLLFNEGYYSESSDLVLREDLCIEAMRLTQLLMNNEQTNLPVVHALFSLMCFHASRFEARKTEYGEIILYNEQDETLWNQQLIAKGSYHLHQAAQGQMLSTYHLEAGIAYWHTIKADSTEKWESILQLYNRLLQVQYSPIAALNRTYALAKANGKKQAITEAEKLNLPGNPYYYTLLGELYTGVDDAKAIEHFQRAQELAKTKADKKLIRRKLDRLLHVNF
jgi:RNA polymerase sigma-70 factor (ECF subfamily)